eukprot:TRINITY_DN48169_c0_g1_i1.p1 TRINITY_DN48169_c0_g1~~TRINITY_DN48169_c0_g1_i1.p1  ORF type:complete len:214 (+),score=14.66 TRINITY_DN48169_c0_g1_i1:71-712(+)
MSALHTVWSNSANAAASREESSSAVHVIIDSSQSDDLSGAGGQSQSPSQSVTAEHERQVQPEVSYAGVGRILGFHARGGRELTMSELHVLGLCNMCYFISTGSECVKGDACGYCHMHWMTREGPKTKPRKSKRAMCGSLAAELDVLLVEDPDAFVTRVIEALSQDDTAITTKIKTKLRQMISSDALNDEQFRRISDALVQLVRIQSTKAKLSL